VKLRIVPYRRGSESAKMLAEALSEKLGYKVWRGDPKRRSLNLNWGSKPNPKWWDEDECINNPIFVHTASDKLLTFNALKEKGVSHVPYTVSKEEAQGYLAAGQTVFARTRSGQAGSGITVVRPGETLPDSQLYTQYVKKQKEFRVHVLRGSVIDVQQKKKRNGAENSLIRNLANGYVFAHEDVVEPAGLRELGVAAVAAVGLDFGAVDIIWNQTQDRCYVLEINTAPGLCNTTCQKYAEAFTANYGG